MAEILPHKTLTAGQGSAPVDLAQPRPLPAWLRMLLSVLIVAHLFAIVAAPLAGPPPASGLSQELIAPVLPYLNATYFNHGYRFFAPMPGPSHLIAYRLEMPDGSIREDVFPNAKTEWPRQWYHRHFMLAENLCGIWEVAQNAILERQANRPQAKMFVSEVQKDLDARVRSLANHLLKESGAERVTLTLRRHYLPDWRDIRDGKKLDDAEFFRTPLELQRLSGGREKFPVDLGTFTPADVAVDAKPPEEI